mmetsp:Transcript_12452/g.27766  ORF Transcript_12452/g.27766 Transcript_12452/m.27766 type:complete len:148 (-) Transcript_12452:42-485(-)
MIQSIAQTMTRRFDLPDRSGAASLNRDARKRELFRITADNHKLMDRLERLRPTFSTKDLIVDHERNQKYMVGCSYAARKAGKYDGARGQRRNQMLSRSTPNLHMGDHTIEEESQYEEDDEVDRRSESRTPPQRDGSMAPGDQRLPPL